MINYIAGESARKCFSANRRRSRRLARKSKGQKRREESTAQPRLTRDIMLAILAIAGLLLTTGLLVLSVTKTSLPYCGSGSGCDIVQASRWSLLFGIPVALWGWGFYLFVTISATLKMKKYTRSRVLIWLASVAFGVSLYLNAISLWVIDATCGYCLVSLSLVCAIYALSWRSNRVLKLGSWRLGSSVASVLLVVFLHLNFSGMFDSASGPEDPYLRNLAEHLSTNNAKFYGAYWCPHCQQQKLVFGASAKRLPYIECSPNGERGAPATECLAENIRNYPTWVIGERRMERNLSPAQLARYSRFKQDEVPDRAEN
jgi:uncharacterized membrane protein